MSERVRTMIEEERVAARIRELGEAISQEYEGREIHLICVLKGGVFFMCELAKRITVPVTMDFMSVYSYGSGTSSSGVVRIVKDLDQPLEGKDVLIVEDIIDSGRTLGYLIEILKKRHPKSCVCARCWINRNDGLWTMCRWITADFRYRMNLWWAMASIMRRNTGTCPT